MHARFYNPQIGRFLSFDPVGGIQGVSQSLNRYPYVLGNPLKYTDPRGLSTSNPFDDDPAATFGESITVTGQSWSILFQVMGLLAGPGSSTSGGFPAGGGGSESGRQSPQGGDQPWPCGSNILLDTLSTTIEDLGPITITGSGPFYPLPGLAGFGGSASFTARPDGSSDLYVGLGGLIGSSARASNLGASFLKASTGGRPGGITLRGAGAVGLLNIVGLPLGIRGSGMITKAGDTASVGPGVVGGASGSVTLGYTFHVTDASSGVDCR